MGERERGCERGETKRPHGWMISPAPVRHVVTTVSSAAKLTVPTVSNSNHPKLLFL